MSAAPITAEERRSLIDAALNGSLTAAQAAALQTLLETDRATCELYAEYARIEAELHLLTRGRMANQAVRRGIGARLPGDAASAAGEGCKAPLVTPPPAGLSGGLWRGTIDTFSQIGPFSYLIATVFMCLMLFGFWLYKIPPNRGSSIASSDNSRRSTTSGEASPHDRPAPVFVGRITGIAGAKWSDEPNYIAPMGVRVALGRTYKLKSGLMEITYDSGAKVILEGPCSYEVDSTAGGYLALGKLVARVGAGGKGRGMGGVVSGQLSVTSVKDEGGRMKEEGDRPNADSLATSHSPLATNPSPLSPLPSPLFTVRTPTAVVTDLGTEFGVEVTWNGCIDIMVMQGSVMVEAGVSDGNGGTRQQICRQGEMVRVDPQEEVVRPITTENESALRFTRVMPPPRFVRDSRTYADFVLSLQPVVYYRMERPANAEDRNVVYDWSGGGHHGEFRPRSEFAGSPYRAGQFGDAMVLYGWDTCDRVIVPDYPKA
ncbi:MAG: hypothetical protein GXY83_22380, partial [Rhodopirellula sp.]|nr:hypothetical protein [Rhodopirellula sp.]